MWLWHAQVPRLRASGRRQRLRAGYGRQCLRELLKRLRLNNEHWLRAGRGGCERRVLRLWRQRDWRLCWIRQPGLFPRWVALFPSAVVVLTVLSMCHASDTVLCICTLLSRIVHKQTGVRRNGILRIGGVRGPGRRRIWTAGRLRSRPGRLRNRAAGRRRWQIRCAGRIRAAAGAGRLRRGRPETRCCRIRCCSCSAGLHPHLCCFPCWHLDKIMRPRQSLSSWHYTAVGHNHLGHNLLSPSNLLCLGGSSASGLHAWSMMFYHQINS